MITPNPDSAHLRTDITWMDRRVDLSEVLSINARNELDVWSADTFNQHLDERYVIGKVARHEDDVVGYMIYVLHKDHIDVLKIEVDPDHGGRGIMEQMIENLAHQLSPARRREIVFHILEADIEMLDIMARCGARESCVQAGSLRAGGRAYVMRYPVRYDGLGTPVTVGDAPGPTSESDLEGSADYRSPAGVTRARLRSEADRPSARSLPEGLSGARRKVTELTNVEWDVVKPDRQTGQFVIVDTASDLEGVDPSDIYLRTVSKLADPAAACDALHAFCRISTKRTYAGSPDKAAQVVIPSRWLLRLVHRQPVSETAPTPSSLQTRRSVCPVRAGTQAKDRPPREGRRDRQTRAIDPPGMPPSEPVRVGPTRPVSQPVGDRERAGG